MIFVRSFFSPASNIPYSKLFSIDCFGNFLIGVNLFLDPMAVIAEFPYVVVKKKRFSNLAENGTNRLDDIKSGPNLVSDQKVDFLTN